MSPTATTPEPSDVASPGGTDQRYLLTTQPIIVGHGLEQCVAFASSGAPDVWWWPPVGGTCPADAAPIRVDGARVTPLPRTDQRLVVYDLPDAPQVTLLVDAERSLRVGFGADAQVVAVTRLDALADSN